MTTKSIIICGSVALIGAFTVFAIDHWLHGYVAVCLIVGLAGLGSFVAKNNIGLTDKVTK